MEGGVDDAAGLLDLGAGCGVPDEGDGVGVLAVVLHV